MVYNLWIMSIVVRLQNLPSLATSRDIRDFFGDLHIPDGGVYITGGEFGGAFISFTSDDDARLAMLKNGCKIMNASVQLYRSSHPEMQQEIARITKQNLDISLRMSSVDSRYCRSPSPRMRSRSPRRWSKSSEMSSTSCRSRSHSQDRDTGMFSYSERSTFMDENILGSKGPYEANTKSEYDKDEANIKSEYDKDEANIKSEYGEDEDNIKSEYDKDEANIKSEYDKDEANIKSEYDKDEANIKSEYDWDIQARFEQKCARASTAGINYFEETENVHQQPRTTTATDSQVKRSIEQFPGPQQSSKPNKETTPPTNTSSVVDLLPPTRLSTPLLPSMETSLPCTSFSPVPVNTLPSITKTEKPNENLFVTLSGLDPEWGLTKLQHVFAGIFIPDKNIKFALNDSGSKTGMAYIKLCNTKDFRDLLSHKRYFHKYTLITVSVCPDYIYSQHFTSETPSERSLSSDRGIYYCEMEGLPVDVTCQDILDFFNDLEVIDLYIAFEKNFKGYTIYDKAKGTVFVAFSNRSDYQKALSKNKHRFRGANSIINIRSTSLEKMLEWKKKNNDLLLQSKSIVPVPDGAPVPGLIEQPFCAILSGLPETVKTKKIFSFFIRSGARPGKIHISLNENQQCDGRAFAEFKNVQIFKKACETDGKRMSKSVISVKEIPYEEMLKVLNSQEPKQGHLLETGTPHSHQTQDTCLDEGHNDPIRKFPEEESSKNTSVTSKTIKVENVFGSAEGEPLGIPLNSFPERSQDVHSKTFHPYRTDRNAKNAPRSFERDFRKGYTTCKYYAEDRRPLSNAYYVSSSNISYSNFEPCACSGRHADYDKVVVQIKNIDPVLTIWDLMDFLEEFEVNENDIIRIFNNDGFPSSDVRVTFRNNSDAECAIQTLNGRFVNGVPVEMFVVPDPTMI